MRKFTDRPVTDDQLREIQELTYLGPTAFNSQPLRITWIKSPEARERLVKHLIEANQEKARQAPVNAILSYDKAWVDRADVFNPRAAETIGATARPRKLLPLPLSRAPICRPVTL